MRTRKHLYRVRWDVSGVGSFPDDMLRYDSAWPVAQADEDEIERHARGGTVSLEAYYDWRYTAEHHPTRARWQSYLWECREVRCDRVPIETVPLERRRVGAHFVPAREVRHG
jgi:hypothetical protein